MGETLVREDTDVVASPSEFSSGGGSKQSGSRGVKRIWIDLDNSPHVPFFAPIIKELERQGYSVFVTARDAYQVWELADFFHLNCTRVGRHYGKHRLLKVAGTCFRALQLMMLVWRKRPDLAVAHRLPFADDRLAGFSVYHPSRYSIMNSSTPQLYSGQLG